jgi:hypothetical protein
VPPWEMPPRGGHCVDPRLVGPRPLHDSHAPLPEGMAQWLGRVLIDQDRRLVVGARQRGNLIEGRVDLDCFSDMENLAQDQNQSPSSSSPTGSWPVPKVTWV